MNLASERLDMHGYEQSVIDRRRFVSLAVAVAGTSVAPIALARDDSTSNPFELQYMLASCMYGYTDISEILPEVRKTGATAIDLWPMKHGNQREQLDEMGEEQFAALLKEHRVSLGCLSQYRAGPFALQSEMRLANRLNCPLIVTAAKGLPNGRDLSAKEMVQELIEQLKPHLEVAKKNNVTLALENHPNNPIDSPDSLKWFVELRPSKHLALAFAPYHLKLDCYQQAALINEIGEGIALFYAWQYGMGSKTKLPIEQELLQMPGRGTLDFEPILESLRAIDYKGKTEIFMHPYPRGKPIKPMTSEVTAEINRSRAYLSSCLRRL